MKDADWFRAFAWTTLSQFVLGATRLALSILVGRFAGKEVLGHTTALLSLTTFLVLSWPQPIGAAAARYLAAAAAERRRDVQTAIAWDTSASAASAALVLAALTSVIGYVLLDVTWTTALCAGVLMCCLSLNAVVRGIRNGHRRFAAAGMWDLAGSSIGLALMVVVLALEQYDLVLLPVAAAFLVSALAAWPRHVATLTPDLRAEVRRYAAWTALFLVSAGGLLPLLTLIAALTSTAQQLGDFGAAVSLATPTVLLSSALLTSLAPFVAGRFATGDLAGVRRAVDMLMRVMVATLLPLFGVAVLWSEPLIVAVFSERFASAADLLALLLVGTSLGSFNAAHVRLLATETWGPRSLAWCNVTGLLAGVISAAVAGPLWGPTGVALGLVVGNFASSASAMVLVWRRDRMPWGSTAVRVCVGYALLGGGFLVTRTADDVSLTGVATLVFLTVLALMSRDEIAKAAALVPGRH